MIKLPFYPVLMISLYAIALLESAWVTEDSTFFILLVLMILTLLATFLFIQKQKKEGASKWYIDQSEIENQDVTIEWMILMAEAIIFVIITVFYIFSQV